MHVVRHSGQGLVYKLNDENTEVVYDDVIHTTYIISHNAMRIFVTREYIHRDHGPIGHVHCLQYLHTEYPAYNQMVRLILRRLQGSHGPDKEAWVDRVVSLGYNEQDGGTHCQIHFKTERTTDLQSELEELEWPKFEYHCIVLMTGDQYCDLKSSYPLNLEIDEDPEDAANRVVYNYINHNYPGRGIVRIIWNNISVIRGNQVEVVKSND